MNLVDLIRDDAIPMDALRERYGSLLALVEKLLGVVPNCDPFFEIWPPAFQSYNVLVPNFLNLPLGVWKPNPLVGLAMYASSRSAGCGYCSAHSCTFALRRGATEDQVANAVGGDGALSPRDQAVVAVARGMGQIPPSLTDEDRAELRRHLSDADAEWVVLAAAMMGFLNKFMDGMGVELELPVIAEVNAVIADSGWVPGKHGALPEKNGPAPSRDGIGVKLGVVRHIPAALSADRAWTAGVPNRWPAVGTYLRERTGHDFPVLSRLRHRRPIRAAATLIAVNLDPATSAVGLATKIAAGRIFADTVGATWLDAALASLHRTTGEPDPAALTLARAVSPSPAVVDDATIDACRSLSSAAIVEVVTFVSVMQMLHRLAVFYP